MIPALRSLTTTPWSDPRSRLLELIEILDTIPSDLRADAVTELSAAKNDSAAALWFAESVLVGGRTPRDLAEPLRHEEWADRLALGIVGAPTVGALSMGRSTRAVVSALRTMRAEIPVIRAASTVIARGLDDLGVITEIGDPTTAEVCLIPVAAFGDHGFWTTQRGADAHAAAPGSIRLADPTTRLGPWSVTRYRPQDWLVLVESLG